MTYTVARRCGFAKLGASTSSKSSQERAGAMHSPSEANSSIEENSQLERFSAEIPPSPSLYARITLRTRELLEPPSQALSTNTWRYPHSAHNTTTEFKPTGALSEIEAVSVGRRRPRPCSRVLPQTYDVRGQQKPANHSGTRANLIYSLAAYVFDAIDGASALLLH